MSRFCGSSRNVPVLGLLTGSRRFVQYDGMRKPVCLAVVSISIVVAAGSLGVALTSYLGLRAYSPKGAAQAAATPAGPNVPATPPQEWNNIFAPGDGMKMASRLTAVTAKSASQSVSYTHLTLPTICSV